MVDLTTQGAQWGVLARAHTHTHTHGQPLPPSWPQEVYSCADSSTDAPQPVQASVTPKWELIEGAQTAETLTPSRDPSLDSSHARRVFDGSTAALLSRKSS